MLNMLNEYLGRKKMYLYCLLYSLKQSTFHFWDFLHPLLVKVRKFGILKQQRAKHIPPNQFSIVTGYSG